MSYSYEQKSLEQLDGFEELNNIRDKIIQSLAENMFLYGISESVGRLYGALYFSNHPLTLDEMREALGMSKTSMSNGVRSLLDTKMVRKVWKKGERKDLYQTEDDWYKTFVDYFSTRWHDAIEANLKTIMKMEKEYLSLKEKNKNHENNEINKEIEADLAKISDIKEYYLWLKKLIETFESGEIFDIVPKPKK